MYAAVAILSLIIWIGWKYLKKRDKSCLIAVFGDLGRSPRIQNHCLNFIDQKYKIDIICYEGDGISEKILQNCTLHYLSTPAKLKSRQALLYILSGIYRIIFQISTILYVALIEIDKPSWILIQNPPSIPTLILMQFYSIFFNIKLIIDWHNYGWTIMECDGANSNVIKVAKWYHPTRTNLGMKSFLDLELIFI